MSFNSNFISDLFSKSMSIRRARYRVILRGGDMEMEIDWVEKCKGRMGRGEEKTCPFVEVFGAGSDWARPGWGSGPGLSSLVQLSCCSLRLCTT